MDNYNDILNHLLTQTENEVVEFKTAENQFDRDKLGRVGNNQITTKYGFVVISLVIFVQGIFLMMLEVFSNQDNTR